MSFVVDEANGELIYADVVPLGNNSWEMRVSGEEARKFSNPMAANYAVSERKARWWEREHPEDV